MASMSCWFLDAIPCRIIWKFRQKVIARPEAYQMWQIWLILIYPFPLPLLRRLLISFELLGRALVFSDVSVLGMTWLPLVASCRVLQNPYVISSNGAVTANCKTNLNQKQIRARAQKEHVFIICNFLARYIKTIRTGDPNESDLTYWMFSYDFKSTNKEWLPEDKSFLERKRKRNALVFALYINVFLIFLTFNSFIAHLLNIIVEFQKFSYPI